LKEDISQDNRTFRNGKVCRGEKRKRNQFRNMDIPADKLKLLEEFGFVDSRENARAFKKIYKDEGDFSKVIDYLCENQKRIQERKEKRKTRREKRDLRDLNTKDKGENKADRKIARYSAKKSKIESKIQRKESQRCRKRARTDVREQFSNPNASATWEGISDIYLDAESLLHTCQALRQLIYKKKDRKKAEELILVIAKEYAKSKGLNTVLIFKEKSEWIDFQDEEMKDDDIKFRVAYASPSHPTPAEFMVAASQNDGELAKRSIFVSKNLVLGELIKSGAKILNPRKFMDYAATLLGKTNDTSYCAWLIEKLGAEVSAEESVEAIGNRVRRVSIEDKTVED